MGHLGIRGHHSARMLPRQDSRRLGWIAVAVLHRPWRAFIVRPLSIARFCDGGIGDQGRSPLCSAICDDPFSYDELVPLAFALVAKFLLSRLDGRVRRLLHSRRPQHCQRLCVRCFAFDLMFFLSSWSTCGRTEGVKYEVRSGGKNVSPFSRAWTSPNTVQSRSSSRESFMVFSQRLELSLFMCSQLLELECPAVRTSTCFTVRALGRLTCRSVMVWHSLPVSTWRVAVQLDPSLTGHRETLAETEESPDVRWWLGVLGTGVAEGLCGSAPSVERRGKVERQGKHHEGNGDAGLAIWALCNVVWSRVVEESILKVTSWLSLTLALCVAVQPAIPHIGDGPSDANRSSSSIVDCPSVFAVLDADGFVCMRCASKSCDEKAEVRVADGPKKK